ncbi:MAG: alpha-galactosidase [Armatimonadetes bacterium]|nr:alpha-galactosidase [Candidatus Hippobium faecium]
MDIKHGYIIEGKEYYFSEDNSGFDARTEIKEDAGIITRKDTLDFKGYADYGEIFLFEDFWGKADYYLHQWCKEFTKKEWTRRNRPVTIYSYGRTTSKYYPYLFISDKGKYCAFNLVPNGDWRIRMQMRNRDMLLIVDRDNTRKFDGRTDIKLDVFMVMGDSPEEVRIRQQEYVRANYYTDRNVPISYNTWIDRFYKLDWDNMTKQAETCAYLGVDTFIVDAGWFGELPAWESIGDWREKKNLFGKGRTLKDFADYVRGLGLKFGIWMEVDKIHKDAPLRVKYPNLFIPTNDDPNYYHYDLLQEEARELMFNEVSNVLIKYDAKWLKIDCNHDLKKTEGDPHVERFAYYDEFLARLQNAFPDCIVENCASGAMKADLGSMKSHAINFPTDTVYAEEIIRIQKEACKVYPPCFINNWCCCHPAKNYWIYGKDNTEGYALNPKDGTGAGMETFPIEYIFGANFLGNLSLTGNFAGFSKSDREKMKKLIDIYKKYRDFIFSAHYLEIESTGYAYILTDGTEEKYLLFVFNREPIYYNTPVRVKTSLSFLPKGKSYKAVNALTGRKEKICGSFNR